MYTSHIIYYIFIIIELSSENLMGNSFDTWRHYFVSFMNYYSALTGDPGQELDSVELLGNNFLQQNLHKHENRFIKTKYYFYQT